MKYKSSLQAVINANKVGHSTYCLLGILERLEFKSVIYIHRDDVHDFVDRHAERMYVGLMEVICGDEWTHKN
jgi:hypothetical protein